MRLAEKIAVVTGGGAGIGRAIRVGPGAGRGGYPHPGCAAGPTPRRSSPRCRRSVGAPRAVRTDVSRAAEVQAALAEGIREFGHLDILVNNAGVVPGLGFPFTRQVEADWDRVLQINLKSVFFTCKAIAPHFMERRSGKIVNIASIAGPLSSQTMPSYSVAKMGVVTFTKIVAKDLAPYQRERQRHLPRPAVHRHVEEDRGRPAGGPTPPTRDSAR